MKRYLLLVLAFVWQHYTFSQTFTLSDQSFVGMYGGSIAFGDIEPDGDQDVLISGTNNENGWVSHLYLNDGAGNFTETNTNIIGCTQGSAEFGDLNGDGYTDLVINGLQPHHPQKFSKLYINNKSGGFIDVQPCPFPPIYNGSLNLVDVDKDGKLDVFMSGNAVDHQTFLYINAGNDENGYPTFKQSSSVISNVSFSTSDFQDFNKDGSPDLLLTGTDCCSRYSQIYLNDGKGNFSLDLNNNEVMLPVHGGAGMFVDLNGDGSLDVIVSGGDQGNINRTKVYINNGEGNLALSSSYVLPDMRAVMLAHDADGDGTPNIFMSGTSSVHSPFSNIYEPTAEGIFSVTESPYEPLWGPPIRLELANVDADPAMELMLQGTKTGGVRVTYLYNVAYCPPSYGTDVQTHCDSYTWIDGKTYTESNSTATHTLTSASGCDSIVTLNLTILPSSTGRDVVESCGPYTWTDGKTYMESNNTATITLTNAAGCDSIVTLNLTVKNPSYRKDEIVSCGPYTWMDGKTYTESNNHATYTLTNAAGCDSIISLNLVVSKSTFKVIHVSSNPCERLYKSPSGKYVWTESGVYLDTIPSSYGCDSILAVDLKINAETYRTINIVSCHEYVAPGGKIFTESGTYKVIIANAQGCDSIITIHLTVVSNDYTVTVSGNTIKANQEGANYRWINCDNGEVIKDQTAAEFTPAANGNYAVVVGYYGCRDTSECVTISTVGIGEHVQASVSAFPNPVASAMTIDLGAVKNVSLTLEDVSGKILRSALFSGVSMVEWDMPESAGIYFLRVRDDQSNEEVIRVIKL